jgi:hypothetical protein
MDPETRWQIAVVWRVAVVVGACLLIFYVGLALGHVQRELAVLLLLIGVAAVGVIGAMAWMPPEPCGRMISGYPILSRAVGWGEILVPTPTACFPNSSTRWRNRIVLVELFALLMGQKKPIFPGELRRVLQLAFRNVGSVTADSRVVAQPLPRNRVDFCSHAQEAAERGDRIDDMAADFLDHETPDRPNSLAGRVVNGRAMYLIALNERMCRARWRQSIGHACFRRGS